MSGNFQSTFPKQISPAASTRVKNSFGTLKSKKSFNTGQQVSKGSLSKERSNERLAQFYLLNKSNYVNE